MRRLRGLKLLFATLVCLLLLPAGLLLADESAEGETAKTAVWPVPEEPSCEPKGGLLARPGATEDEAPLPFQPGDVFGLDRVDLL